MNSQHPSEHLQKNLELIRGKIILAARKAGRDPSEITLVAVSKKKPCSMIHQAIQAGLIHFGESFLQEAKEKIAVVKEPVCWHFIGHLQSNKARDAARLFDVIETIDRQEIAARLHRHLEGFDRSLNALVQVNIGCEPQKKGVHPEHLEKLLMELQPMTRIKLCGLMALPPWSPDPEATRPFFRQLKQLADRMGEKGLFPGVKRIELSMGMSADFEVAIQEGATIVRVGTALFGSR